MTNPHLTEAELVRFAFLDHGAAPERLPPHLTECAECHSNFDLLRAGSNAMRVASPSINGSSNNCLDAEYIAAIAEGSEDVGTAPQAFAHLLECARCRREVAAVARLLEVPEVRMAVDELGRSRHSWRRRVFISGSLVAAATAAAIFVAVGRPSAAPRLAPAIYREESVTAFAAPHLIAPIGNVSTISSFQWGSVPRADSYRITLYARDGSVLWEAFTRDTTLAAPDLVRRAPRDTALWRVAAHVGWEDRWAASDLSMVTLSHGR